MGLVSAFVDIAINYTIILVEVKYFLRFAAIFLQ